MCLDRQTKRVLADPKPSSCGAILELVLRDQAIILWLDLIPRLQKKGWENKSILAFFQWIDRYVPVLNANGKVDPVALCWALLEAHRAGIAKIARESDARRIDPRDRLIRNVPWLKKLDNSTRIANARIRRAIENNVVLESDRRLLEAILNREGVVTSAGNVKPALLRAVFEEYGFNIGAHYELTLARSVKVVLFPELDPVVTHRSPIRIITDPGASRPKMESRPTESVSVRTVSKRMAATHRSLLIVLDILVCNHRWTRDENLLPPAIIWAVIRNFWPRKRNPDKCFDWLEDNGLVVWHLTAELESGQYVLYYVPPSPLVVVRSGDFTNARALDRVGARGAIAEAFTALERDPKNEPRLIRLATQTATHRVRS